MDFPIVISSENRTPMYRQLAGAFRDAIMSGRLKPGEVLPPTKKLSSQLQISRATVVKAYEELLSQRWIETSTGVGTFVRRELPLETRCDDPPAQSPIPLSAYAQRLMECEPETLTSGCLDQINYGAGDADLLPIKVWRQTILKHCRIHKPSRADFQMEPFGYMPLREAVAGYLRRARALRCDPEQIAVFPRSLYAHEVITRLLVDPDDTVAVEDPGFPFAHNLFYVHGANIRSVPVDQHGIIVDKMYDLPRETKLAYVTPSHHDPTGAVMPMQRRKDLLKWAQSYNAAIIEDDYDSEYRYGGPPMPSLQGMDENDRVIYVSSFWKTLFPMVTLGFMVIPKSLLPAFYHAEQPTETNFPLLEQFALTDFINEGHLEQHIRKTRTIYARRWQTLVHALTKGFGRSVSIPKETSGTHVTVTFDLNMSDFELVECANKAGFSMASTQNYYLSEPVAGQFIVPFSHFKEEELTARTESFVKAVAEIKSNEQTVQLPALSTVQP